MHTRLKEWLLLILGVRTQVTKVASIAAAVAHRSADRADVGGEGAAHGAFLVVPVGVNGHHIAGGQVLLDGAAEGDGIGACAVIHIGCALEVGAQLVFFYIQ